MLEAYGAFGEEAGDAILGGEGLQPTSTATTVRVRDGERMLTDGPFAETKEQLGGFYLLECNSLDEAIELGGQDPGSAVRLGRGAAGHELRGRRGRGRTAIGGGSQLAAPGAVVDRLFRRESGRAVATLIRILGDFDLAEEAVQEAFATAVERWPRDGVPPNPGGWIVRTARNSAIDRLRRERALRGEAARARGAGRRRGVRRGHGNDPRRPAAAVLHLLPPGARARGAGGAHAADPRRPLHAGGGARLPGRRDGDAAAARAGQAQDPDGGHPLRGPGGPPAARSGCARCWPRST